MFHGGNGASGGALRGCPRSAGVRRHPEHTRSGTRSDRAIYYGKEVVNGHNPGDTDGYIRSTCQGIISGVASVPQRNVMVRYSGHGFD